VRNKHDAFFAVCLCFVGVSFILFANVLFYHRPSAASDSAVASETAVPGRSHQPAFLSNASFVFFLLRGVNMMTAILQLVVRMIRSARQSILDEFVPTSCLMPIQPHNQSSGNTQPALLPHSPHALKASSLAIKGSASPVQKHAATLSKSSTISHPAIQTGVSATTAAVHRSSPYYYSQTSSNVAQRTQPKSVRITVPPGFAASGAGYGRLISQPLPPQGKPAHPNQSFNANPEWRIAHSSLATDVVRSSRI
jgi:hypothetical protein